MYFRFNQWLLFREDHNYALPMSIVRHDPGPEPKYDDPETGAIDPQKQLQWRAWKAKKKAYDSIVEKFVMRQKRNEELKTQREAIFNAARREIDEIIDHNFHHFLQKRIRNPMAVPSFAKKVEEVIQKHQVPPDMHEKLRKLYTHDASFAYDPTKLVKFPWGDRIQFLQRHLDDKSLEQKYLQDRQDLENKKLGKKPWG